MTVAIDFPNSPPPNNGDTYTPANGITYTYNNGKWKGNVSSGPADQLINGSNAIKLENNGILSSDAGNTIRLRSSGQGGATSIEYTGNVTDPTPYNAKVEVGNQFVHIHAAGDTRVWGFDAYGKLTLPNAMTIDASDSFGTVKIGGSNTQIRIDDGGAPPGLYIRTDMAGADHGWLFGTDGELTFPDATVQTTAYRNRPLTNLNLNGGTASTIFEIDMTFVDCGGSYLRGILTQDQYDGGEDNSSPNFDKFLDGGQA